MLNTEMTLTQTDSNSIFRALERYNDMKGVPILSNFNDISNLLQSFIGNGPAGCGCAIARNGKTLYEGYFGLADIESGRPVSENTVYRLYSMSKVIVCTGALILFERGKYLLDDPIYEYMPEYRHINKFVTDSRGETAVVPASNPMLVKHAFSMAVGLGYPGGKSTMSQQMNEVNENLKKTYGKYNLRTQIKAMASVPVAFEPGTHWHYGYGHELVAGMIEAASGMTVAEFLKKEVFEPLGMKSTGYRFHGDIEGRMASEYRRSGDGKMTKVANMFDDYYQPDAIYEGGGSGIYSTVGDYLRFSQMMANGGELDGVRIIGRKTIDLMRRNQLNETQLKDFANPYLAGYGYGLGVRTMMDPAQGNCNGSVGEFGWSGFGGTYTLIDPAEGFSVVYMQQLQPSMEERIHRSLRAAAYGCL
jgi:CubicO group peptidase (beta-lactamase class C family)